MLLSQCSGCSMNECAAHFQSGSFTVGLSGGSGALSLCSCSKNTGAQIPYS